MRLTIRTSHDHGYPQLVLCDEDGVKLPGQTSTKFNATYGGRSTFTVTFSVHADVAFEPEKQPSLKRPVVAVDPKLASDLHEALLHHNERVTARIYDKAARAD